MRQHERRYNDPAQKEAPDGERIAFVNRRNFAPGIYTMSSDGTKQKKAHRGPAVVFTHPQMG